MTDEQFEWVQSQVWAIRMAAQGIRTIALVWLILWMLGGLMSLAGMKF